MWLALPAHTQEVVTTLLRAVGGDVPGAGEVGSGVPADAKWTSFGIPAVNEAGDIAFVGEWTSTSGDGGGVFVNDKVVATENGAATDWFGNPISGVTFTGFAEPALGITGRVVFLATLQGLAVSKANNIGIWTSPKDGGVRLVARQGIKATGNGAADALTGSPAMSVHPDDSLAGASFKKLLSYSVGKDEIIFVGQLSPRTGLVSGESDVGAWVDYANNRFLGLRENDLFGESRVKQFLWNPKATGRLHMADGTGEYSTFSIVLTSPRQSALLRRNHSNLFSIFISSGAPVDALSSIPKAPGVFWKDFSTPDFSSTGMNYGFRARLSGGGINTGIFLNCGTGPLTLALADGIEAPDSGGARFASFRDPAIGEINCFAVHATLAGDGVKSPNQSAIYWHNQGTLTLLARQSEVAPGTGGAVFKRFSALCYNANVGPLFLADLQIPKRGSSNPGNVRSANDKGLWAIDSTGTLRLAVREGDSIEGRTIASFTALHSPKKTQRTHLRSFNANRMIVYLATFTDGTTGIVQAALP
jgi:hypothetical protein